MNQFNLKWVYYLPSCQAVPSNATEVQSQNCDRSRKTNRAKLFNIHCSLGETKGPQSYAYLLAYLPRSPSSWVRMSSATTYLPVFLWLPTNVKTEPTIGKNKFFKKNRYLFTYEKLHVDLKCYFRSQLTISKLVDSLSMSQGTISAAFIQNWEGYCPRKPPMATQGAHSCMCALMALT